MSAFWTWLRESYWSWQKRKAQRAALNQAYLEAARRQFGVTGDLSGLDARTKEEWRCMQREIDMAVAILDRGDLVGLHEQQSMAGRLRLAAKGERH